MGSGSLGFLATVDLSPAGIANIEGDASPSGSWDTGSGTPWMTYTSGGALLTGGYDGTVRLWRLPGFAADALAGFTQDTAISVGTHLMVAPLEYGVSSSSRTGIWDISAPSDPMLESTLPFDPLEVSFLGSSSGLLVATQMGPVQLWDLTNPRHPVLAAVLGSLSTSSDTAAGGGLATSTAGTLVSVFSSDGKEWLWRISHGFRATRLGAIPVPGTSTDLPALMPDGRTAFILTPKGIQWWDVANPARPLPAGFSALPRVSTGSVAGTNGVLAADAEDANYSMCDCYDLRLFNLSRGHVTASASVSDMRGDQIAVSDDSSLLAAAGPGDNGLTLWTVSTPRRPVFDASLATVPDLQGIAISADDKRLADWDNGTLQLWDITNPAHPALLATVSFSSQPDDTGIISDISSAMFAPSGPELAVALNDAIVLVNTDPAALVEQYCAETGSTITQAEWSRYTSNLPYQNPCPDG